MRGNLLQEKTDQAMKRGSEKFFAFFPRTRLIYAAVISLAIAAIVVPAIYSYRAIDRELTESALSRRAAVAQLAAAVLSEKFARLADIASSLATRVRFRELIEVGEWTEAIKILSGIPRDFPFIDRITLHDLRGTLMADVPEAPAVRGQNFAYRDWYQAVVRDGKPYISQVYRRVAAPQMNVFVAAVPVKNGKGEMLGILAMQVRSDTFFEWTRGVDVGYSGFIYVVDQRGTLAAHPKFPPQGDLVDYSSVPVVQRVLQGKRGVEIAFNPAEKEERIVSYQPIEIYGWSVVVEQPAATVFETRDDQLQLVLIAYGLIPLFMASMMFVVSRIVSQRRQFEVDRRMKAELERMVAERTAQLSDSEERHRAVVDTAVDAISVIDERGAIQRFNPGAERMFGYSEAEVVGKNVSLLMPSPYREQHDGYLARFLATGEKRIIGIGREVVGRRKDGTEFPIYLAVAEMRLGESRMFTGIIRDITEAKRAAEQQAHLLTSLEAANKELESFSYSVSHDLRSPLRAIDGFSRIVQEDYGDRLDGEGKRLLGVVRDNSRKMGRLIDDLLEFSRLGRKQLSAAEINTKRLVEEVLGELQAGSERRTRLTIGALPPAYGDVVLIKQVWVNLLDNAIKFSGRREQPMVEVSGSVNGTENVYCVKDNGAGFDMQYYDKLFGVFQRLHSAEEFDGTGVGLAIVQRVVARHGGRVWAEGKVGEGATFYFSLPKGRHDG